MIRLRVPDPLLAKRTGLTLRVRTAGGGDTTFSLGQFSPVSRDDSGVIYELPLQYPGDLTTWTLTVTETLQDQETGGVCTLSSERNFLAGGPSIQSTAQPAVAVASTMRNMLFERNGRVFSELVFTDVGFKALVTHRVTVTCRIGDDGAGNPVVPAAVLRIVPAAVSGAGASAALVCGSPPAMAPGTTWTEQVARRYQVKVRATRNGQRRWPWQVQLDGFSSVSGQLIIRHSGYDRGYVKRIYETNFDAYWNTCISKGRRIYASGGRLYCIGERLGPNSTATVRLTGP